MARWSFRRSLVAGALGALGLLAAVPAGTAVDFRNFAYPHPPCGTAGGAEMITVFALRDGRFDWSGGRAILYLSGARGHLRGDASVQAAILLDCAMPTPARYQQFVDVFDVRAGSATFVTMLGVGIDEHHPVRSVAIAGGRVVVRDRAGAARSFALRAGRLVPARAAMRALAPPAVDFANFGPYPSPPCKIGDEEPPPFTLARGGASWTAKGGDSGLDYQLRSVSVGHLRGDASYQAAVLLGCDFPAPAFYQQWVDVFDLRDGGATFVDSAPAGYDGDPTRSAAIVGARLRVVTGRATLYALRGARLVRVAR